MPGVFHVHVAEGVAFKVAYGRLVEVEEINIELEVDVPVLDHLIRDSCVRFVISSLRGVDQNANKEERERICMHLMRWFSFVSCFAFDRLKE